MKRIKLVVNFLASAFFLEVTLLCLIASYSFINDESMITLLIFDVLFVSLAFQLNGTLTRKLSLLAAGTALGLFCNLTFVSFSVAGVEYFGQAFNVFYGISFPVLNTLWIVTFWSLTLTALPKPANTKNGER